MISSLQTPSSLHYCCLEWSDRQAQGGRLTPSESARVGGRKVSDGADHVDLDRLKRLLQDLAQPILGVGTVVEDSSPVQGPKERPSERCVCSRLPRMVPPNNTPSGARTAATVLIAAAF